MTTKDEAYEEASRQLDDVLTVLNYWEDTGHSIKVVFNNSTFDTIEVEYDTIRKDDEG